ncbi:MAG TPA: hypothetical protein VIO33_05910 [Burkholderiaceae bacterium]
MHRALPVTLALLLAAAAAQAHTVSMSGSLGDEALQVGDVTVYNVAASIVPVPMDYVQLGNSFQTRFQMKRENDTLTLVKRY